MNWMNNELIELHRSDYITLICGSTHNLQKVPVIVWWRRVIKLKTLNKLWDDQNTIVIMNMENQVAHIPVKTP